MAKQPTAQLIFPNREAVTTGQLANALQVCSMTVTALINPWRGFVEGEDAPKNPEARIALENTLIKACNRLDEILSDDRRWSVDYQMALEDEFKKSHAQNLRYVEAHASAAEEVASPHYQHRPKLAKSADGKMWVAILGDERDLNNALVGIGRTPEEALAEFDKNFQGKENSPEVIAFLKQRAEQTNYGKDKQNMDGTGVCNADQPVVGKQISGVDSGDAQPPRSIRPGTDAAFGPARPQYEGRQAGRVGLTRASREGQVPRKAGLRAIASRLSRFFRLGQNRSGR
jgi:hypothetical protein